MRVRRADTSTGFVIGLLFDSPDPPLLANCDMCRPHIFYEGAPMIRAMLATMMFTRVEGPLVMMALRVCTWHGGIHSCSHTSGHACVTCRLLAAVVANNFAATALTT